MYYNKYINILIYYNKYIKMYIKKIYIYIYLHRGYIFRSIKDFLDLCIQVNDDELFFWYD